VTRTWYRVRPEVAGGLGERSRMDTTVHPPRVDHVHYVFSGWLGDDIVESFPCFLVADHLARAIAASTLTGIQLDDVEVSVEPQFERLLPDVAAALPAWVWLRITGRPERDDFWLDDGAQLHVSEHAYQLLQRFEVSNADFRP
jgi:hypothetical protein